MSLCPQRPHEVFEGEYLTGNHLLQTAFAAEKNHKQACVKNKFYGQAERAISNGQLNVLLRLHTRPIKLVVYQCSYYLLRLGDLILRKVSRLYAFSVYPNRTSLPSYATGVTTGSQEVGSSRSSRTKDKPPQISYAHHR